MEQKQADQIGKKVLRRKNPERIEGRTNVSQLLGDAPIPWGQYAQMSLQGVR